MGASWVLQALQQWYQTWWFGLAIGMFIAVLVYAVMRARIEELDRENAILDETLRDQGEELMSVNQRLADATMHDDETGLSNRRYFDAIYVREWGRAVREWKTLGLMMLSVDFFESFEDRYGDEAAESCMRRIAEVLQRSLRGSIDFAARFDEEEFAVLLPGTSIENASAVAERIRQRIEALWIPHEDSNTATHVTVSIGVASVAPSEDLDPYSLMNQAGHALDAAKTVGGNRVATTDAAMASV